MYLGVRVMESMSMSSMSMVMPVKQLEPKTSQVEEKPLAMDMATEAALEAQDEAKEAKESLLDVMA